MQRGRVCGWFFLFTCEAGLEAGERREMAGCGVPGRGKGKGKRLKVKGGNRFKSRTTWQARNVLVFTTKHTKSFYLGKVFSVFFRGSGFFSHKIHGNPGSLFRRFFPARRKDKTAAAVFQISQWA